MPPSSDPEPLSFWLGVGERGGGGGGGDGSGEGCTAGSDEGSDPQGAWWSSSMESTNAVIVRGVGGTMALSGVHGR